MSTFVCEVSQNAARACLFTENPYRLVSLWEMLQVHADKFIAMLNHLSEVAEMTTFDYKKTAAILLFIRSECPDLRSAVKQAARIESLAKENPGLPD